MSKFLTHSMCLPVSRLIVVVLLGFFLNPGLAASFEDTLAQRTQACTGCHGDQGRAGPDGYYPRLAGKPAGYLFNQLLNIRDGRRHYPLMASLLEPLSDNYLLEIAQYFSALSIAYPTPKAVTVAPDALARGQNLVRHGDPVRDIPPCQQCHGQALTGAEPHVPGLLGLPRDYLNAQLGGWRTGQRRAAAPDCMSHIASRLSTQEVADVTYWLAAQPVPDNSKPLATVPPLRAGAIEVRCGSAGVSEKIRSLKQAASVATGLPALARQGAYLARVGNCVTCHTAPGGAMYAGQRPIPTPFGTAYSSNLTPDKDTGLGNWNAQDFWQALHHGKSRDGRLLSPVFPYPNYTRVTRADSDALFAFFQTLPAVHQPRRAHDMPWPFDTQLALAVWRTLFFSPQVFVPDGNQSDTWNRGAYLVNGLGHCGACHTPRNALGAMQENKALSGAMIPVQNWYAPSLLKATAAGIDQHNLNDTLQLLKSGISVHAASSGPMALVVQGGTQHLTATDLHAMSVYLQTLSSTPVPGRTPPSPAPTGILTGGATLYKTHCASCHGAQGQGVAMAYPPLVASRAVLLPDASNLIQSVLHGGFAPTTAANPRPYGMPPFVLTLTDQDIAHVLTYVRNAWGNQASAVTEQQVNRLRDRQTH